jgi:hypothetical protein
VMAVPPISAVKSRRLTRLPPPSTAIPYHTGE